MTGVVEALAALLADIDATTADNQGPGTITAARVRQSLENLIVSLVGIGIPTSASSPQAAGFTFALADVGYLVGCTASGAANATIPLHSSVATNPGEIFSVQQQGTGAVTLVGAGGVTFNTPFPAVTSAQWCIISARCRATDVWDFMVN